MTMDGIITDSITAGDGITITLTGTIIMDGDGITTIGLSTTIITTSIAIIPSTMAIATASDPLWATPLRIVATAPATMNIPTTAMAKMQTVILR